MECGREERPRVCDSECPVSSFVCEEVSYELCGRGSWSPSELHSEGDDVGIGVTLSLFVLLVHGGITGLLCRLREMLLVCDDG